MVFEKMSNTLCEEKEIVRCKIEKRTQVCYDYSHSSMQGETGVNPVRARRREAHTEIVQAQFIKRILIYPDATIWGKPLGEPEKADKEECQVEIPKHGNLHYKFKELCTPREPVVEGSKHRYVQI